MSRGCRIIRNVLCATVVALPLMVASPASAQHGGNGHNGYRIGPDDVLNISVWKNEALSRVVAVRPDGRISLPLLNDVQAAGFTPEQLRAFDELCASRFQGSGLTFDYET